MKIFKTKITFKTKKKTLKKTFHFGFTYTLPIYFKFEYYIQSQLKMGIKSD